ncbi:MAG TPA: hypothetical protein VM618_02705 [Acidimicrobiia bacterium]|nr:hypothetical protein [Acidimicrobiia bacterium]
MFRKSLVALAALAALAIVVPAHASPPVAQPVAQPAGPVGVVPHSEHAGFASFWEYEEVSETVFRETWTTVYLTEWNGEAWVGAFEDAYECGPETCEWLGGRWGETFLEPDEYEASLQSITVDTMIGMNAFDPDSELGYGTVEPLSMTWTPSETLPQLDSVHEGAHVGQCWASAWAGASVHRTADAAGSLGGKALADGAGDMVTGAGAGAFADCYGLSA